MGAAIIILLSLSIRGEIMQIINLDSKLEYFLSFWNWLDITGLLLTLLITLIMLLELDWIPIESLRVMASFAICLLTLKIYDWLRLFETTSFFILLIGRTFIDIGPFMIFFAVALIAFGLPMSILDLNRSEDAALISETYGYWFLDALINQYLLSLGEFASLETMEGGS